MYYVMFGQYGECYGEYETFEEAEKVAMRLDAEGEDSWICSDEYDEPSDLEMGFDPYEGGYSWDC